METIQSINLRKSTRNYKENQIADEILDKIICAGEKAPVASGKYDEMLITVIQDKEILNEISDKVIDLIFNITKVKRERNFIAPTLIIVSAKAQKVVGVEYANAGCILENMVLAATDLGVDSLLWAGACSIISKDNNLKNKLKIPDDFNPILCGSFGYCTTKENPKEHEIQINKI